MRGCDKNRFYIPIDRDGFYLGHVVDELLIAEISEPQRFWTRPQGHQRDDLASINFDCQRRFPRDMNIASVSIFIDRFDRVGRCQTFIREFWKCLGLARHIRPCRQMAEPQPIHLRCAQRSPVVAR